MKRIRFQTGQDDAGERLDKVIAARTPLSRGEARRLIDLGSVFVEGSRVRVAGRPLKTGQEVRLHLEEAGRSGPAEGALPKERLLHADPDLVAVDKPPGVPAQATLTRARGALPDLVSRALGSPAHLVHRLDRDTSGVTVFARSRQGTSRLGKAFRDGLAQKTYVAVTVGAPPAPSGRTDRPLAPDPAAPGRFVTADEGTPAATRWSTAARFGEDLVPGGFALLILQPETGRTHQLRVHLAALGCPILGDRRYGAPDAVTFADGRRIEIPRMLLHAWRLTVPHPRTGAAVSFEAPLPDDFGAALEQLGAPGNLRLP